jgi:hypothetical protein
MDNTRHSRNTLVTTNLEEEEIVDAPGKDGNVSMPEQVKRPDPWRKMMMIFALFFSIFFNVFTQLALLGTHTNSSSLCVHTALNVNTDSRLELYTITTTFMPTTF